MKEKKKRQSLISEKEFRMMLKGTDLSTINLYLETVNKHKDTEPTTLTGAHFAGFMIQEILGRYKLKYYELEDNVLALNPRIPKEVKSYFEAGLRGVTNAEIMALLEEDLKRLRG